ncbi:hypothetical protein BJV77DRAFT_977295, partial [Russula vinacea]
MSTYYVPSTPPPFRGRAYSFSQGAPYGTPYSPYAALPGPQYGGLGVARSAPYYVTPTVAVRGRSHSRPRHGHSHHRSGHHHHTHRRSRSHSAVAPHRHSRPSGHHQSYRYQTARLLHGIPTTRHHWASAFSNSSVLGAATATETNTVVSTVAEEQSTST